MIGIGHYVAVSAVMFVLGVLGIFLNRKNVIIILMAIELILLAVNLNFVPKTKHSQFLLNDNDQVEVIAPVTGG